MVRGAQRLIEGGPERGVGQKDLQAFVLFLGLTSSTKRTEAVQDTQVHQHLQRHQDKVFLCRGSRSS